MLVEAGELVTGLAGIEAAAIEKVVRNSGRGAGTVSGEGRAAAAATRIGIETGIEEGIRITADADDVSHPATVSVNLGFRTSLGQSMQHGTLTGRKKAVHCRHWHGLLSTCTK